MTVFIYYILYLSLESKKTIKTYFPYYTNAKQSLSEIF